jgi:LysM repeat protein
MRFTKYGELGEIFMCNERIHESADQNLDDICYEQFRRIDIPGLPRVHIVRLGDTLFRIAQMYQTTVERLVEINNITNPDVIFPGQRLIIPAQRLEPSAELPVLREGSANVHVIYLQRLLLANGYNIGVIDGAFGPRVRREVEMFQRDRGLQVTGVVDRSIWQALIRGGAEIVRPPAFPLIYEVRSGDTLYSIARTYNVSVGLLARVNRIENPNLIYSGTRLIIPLQ